MRDELESYRRSYDALPFADHQAMYRRIGDVYPEQAYWNAPDCAAFLAHYRPASVLEIGGHDGALAREVLPAAHYVNQWVNLELVDCEQVCSDYRYEFVVLGDWAWASPLTADALILSHVIEHVSEKQLTGLLAALEVDCVYVDAPLAEDSRSNWGGSMTAHVLPHSMRELDEAFSARGFRVAHTAVSNAHGFESRTRWYELV